MPHELSGIRVVDAGPESLAGYARIPIAFRVESTYSIAESPVGLGLTLSEEPVAEPFVKDYDAIDRRGQRVLEWPDRFDITNWHSLLAMDGEVPVGGAAVLCDSSKIHLLNERRDLGLLWDIRVQPGLRRRGVGTTLWNRAAGWALVSHSSALEARNDFQYSLGASPY